MKKIIIFLLSICFMDACKSSATGPSNLLMDTLEVADTTINNQVSSIHPSIPSFGSTEGLGINTHFLPPAPGEMEMLSDAGFQWQRINLFWRFIENDKGVYIYPSYDKLMDSLIKYNVKAIVLLAYSNPLYDDNKAPYTSQARNAFARYAAECVKRYAGHGFLWEIWSEPNIGSYTTKLDVYDYIQLAKVTAKAIREVAPGEAVIGPAASKFPLDYLELCFKSGLLEDWDAVSVHPYRLEEDPESVIEDYKELGEMIDKYAPAGKEIPIISGEWGYSNYWNFASPEQQGKLLARQFLTNMSNNIPLSIWYDWQDDGTDPANSEHHFGIVKNTYYPNRDPVYDPKPAYFSAKTLMKTLNGFVYKTTLNTTKTNDYVLFFEKQGEDRLILWTTDEPHMIQIKIGGKYKVIDYKGNELPELSSKNGTLEIALDDAPKYLIPIDK